MRPYLIAWDKARRRFVGLTKQLGDVAIERLAIDADACQPSVASEDQNLTAASTICGDKTT